MNLMQKLGYEREMTIMKEMNHPFIIKYMEEFVYEERVLCIVTQFVEGGDFDTFMNS
jgi:serine/threonine protein kinase